MNSLKKYFKKFRFKWVFFVILIFLFNLISNINLYGYEWIIRLIGILILTVALPLVFLYFIIHPAYKEHFSIVYKGKRYYTFFKLISLSLAIFFLSGSYNVILDVISITNNDIPYRTGIVSQEEHWWFGFPFFAQDFKFQDDSNRKFHFVFGDYSIIEGENLGVKYLTRSRYVLVIKHL